MVRIVEGIRGKVPVRMELALRFDYGRTVPWVTRIKDGVRAVAGPNLAVLHASVPVHGENLKTVADFTVRQGERVCFTLTYGSLAQARSETNRSSTGRSRIRSSFWQRVEPAPQVQGQVSRCSRAIADHAQGHDFRPTGGMVAAVTTSLPEAIGGVRNWDYRYCWLRDTTFTLLALTNAGYFNEAAAWQDWLLRALAGSPEQVQIMYGLKGERQLVEWEVGLASRI